MISEEALAKVALIIIRMRTANVPSKATWKARQTAHSKRIIDLMMSDGVSYGAASGGALSFLAEMSGPEDLRKVDNDLNFHAGVVAGMFEEYLARGEVPAPHYAWRICIILRREKETKLEREFLSAWCTHFGAVDGGATYDALRQRYARVCAQ